MTKAILENNLLVSGTSAPPISLELERKCQSMGFSIGRTGQFGIGVLSYFMLADRVEITTCRTPHADDADGKTWIFETNGVGSFGELRSSPLRPNGTEISLRLRPDIIGSDVRLWFQDLAQYIKGALLRLPCPFELHTSLEGFSPYIAKTGWLMSESEWVDLIVSRFRINDNKYDTKVDFGLLPDKLQQEATSHNLEYQAISTEIRQHLKLICDEGELPGGLGYYRVILPYFDLPKGQSLAFLRVQEYQEKLRLEPILQQYAWVPDGFIYQGWKGVAASSIATSSEDKDRIEAELHRTRYVWRLGFMSFGEIDWTSKQSGRIALDREQIKLSDDAEQARRWLYKHVLELYREVFEKDTFKVYSAINAYFVADSSLSEEGTHWIQVNNEKLPATAEWVKMKFPAICLPPTYCLDPKTELIWNGIHVNAIQELSLFNGPNQFMTWRSHHHTISRLVQLNGEWPSLTEPVWTENFGAIRKEKEVLSVTKFPPGWTHIIGTSASTGFVWNEDNPVVTAVNDVDMRFVKDLFELENTDPLQHKALMLASKGRAASWIVDCLMKSQTMNSKAAVIWDGLQGRDEGFLSSIWQLFWLDYNQVESEAHPIIFLQGMGMTAHLHVLTPRGWSNYEGLIERGKLTRSKGDNWLKFMPYPEAEWTMEVKRTKHPTRNRDRSKS